MSAEKNILHPRNKHRSRYDFPELIRSCVELRPFVALNPYGDQSIDFSNPLAVKMLNKALLSHFYGIKNWDIPEHYLCPPIPGRADYIHYVADLLSEINQGVIPTGKNIKGLDIGVGANCIYPIIGHQEYGWSFTGSDIDPLAVKAAKNIVAANLPLSDTITLKHQQQRNHIFKGLVKPAEQFDFSICNPPFHASAAEAAAGSTKKVRNLGRQKSKEMVLNFGGQHTELWCEGGEVSFIRKMIDESTDLANQCLWFTSLVSKSSNLPFIYRALERVKPFEVRTVEMAQGQKVSRFVAWTFLSFEEQAAWAKKRWSLK
jgi:23S rRNA (adenine1618-N6)-methyltransferase